MNKSISTFVGFVAGAATGAITGMLVAPDKGYKTRKRLAKKVNEISSQMEEQVKQEFKDVGNTIKNKTHRQDKEPEKSKAVNTVKE
ncbi:YtxH domain-containing protein [Prolixibacter sp. NT017]|uniref:YtxH domain-containing protein n=1 Tax=Prolixibacter sp. NT017 TaxID=2652390 RepID=UPI001285E361|nr:YtxH domain-containing protein [Prolixibacter sp. NT017]GET25016.1 hypothetical protein NT017_13450 [Prolixibacter sp. NT017]